MTFLVLASSLLLSARSASQQVHATSEQARAIAKEAYIYGVPLLDQYRVTFAFSIAKGNPEYKGPFNSILNIARVYTPDDKAFVSPNADTPYTFVAIDLRTEPMVLTVPEVEKGRYYSFQFMDMYTYNFAYVGSRTTGNGAGSFLIAGPYWHGETPTGIKKVIRAETETVSGVGRTQLFGPDDIENVKKIQSGYKLQPLSQFFGKPAPPAAPEVNWIRPLMPEDQKTDPQFFNVLSFLLQFCPAPPEETQLRARFASIGIVPGKSIDLASLSPEIKQALVDGMADGQREIDLQRTQLLAKKAPLWGTRESEHDDFTLRAVGAQVALGANSPEEAIYVIYQPDASGEPFEGTHRYTVHFPKGQEPPVNAFWSLTMYDLPGQFLVANPINRYLINSPMLPNLKRDADGGITLYIQSDPPPPPLEPNWLPAPTGPFMMALRLYWPKAAVIDGRWEAPAIHRTP